MDRDIHNLRMRAQVKPLISLDAEFAGPAWVFGSRSYQALPGGGFLVVYNDPKARGEPFDIFGLRSWCTDIPSLNTTHESSFE